MAHTAKEGGHDPQLCALCPKLCRFACPVATATADEGATPTAMLAGLRMAEAGLVPWQAAADNLAKCTGCGACEAPCEYDQDVPAMLYQGRAQAWDEGAIAPGSQALHERFLEHGNPFSADLGEVLREQGEDGDFQRKGRVLFWPGCRSLAERPEQVRRTVEMLRSLGAEHVSLPAREDVPTCCGAPLRVIGDQTGLRVVASALNQYFNRQRTWVTSSSSCLSTVIDGYREAGLSINAELLHLGEYLLFYRAKLAQLATESTSIREARGEAVAEVVVHDACALQRRLGRATAIHQVVETVTGAPSRSLAPSAARTHCCGAGDFHDLRRPEAAAAVGLWAAQTQPAPAGAWIVTGDSDCVACLQASHPRNRVLGLAEFLHTWLEPVLGE